MEFLIITAEFGLKTKLVPVVFCFVLLFKVSLKLILLYFPNFWYINLLSATATPNQSEGEKTHSPSILWRCGNITGQLRMMHCEYRDLIQRVQD